MGDDAAEYLSRREDFISSVLRGPMALTVWVWVRVSVRACAWSRMVPILVPLGPKPGVLASPPKVDIPEATEQLTIWIRNGIHFANNHMLNSINIGFLRPVASVAR